MARDHPIAHKGGNHAFSVVQAAGAGRPLDHNGLGTSGPPPARSPRLLGLLPLALKQAGAYIREIRLSLVSHLERLQRYPALTVAKSNVKSRVHRRGYMDYVGVKRYGADGLPSGEVRFVGLFTAEAYDQPAGWCR